MLVYNVKHVVYETANTHDPHSNMLWWDITSFENGIFDYRLRYNYELTITISILKEQARSENVS